MIEDIFCVKCELSKEEGSLAFFLMACVESIEERDNKQFGKGLDSNL